MPGHSGTYLFLRLWRKAGRVVFRGGSQSDEQMAPKPAHSAGEPLNLNHVEVSSQPLDYAQTFA